MTPRYDQRLYLSAVPLGQLMKSMHLVTTHSDMNQENLRLLLGQKESATLEFKRELYTIEDSDGEAKQRQRDELTKDILSLANGSASVTGRTAYLIIGADDKLNADGSRNLYDVGEWTPSKQTILNIVNSACDPPIEIECETVEFEGKRIFVITIPPSPHLHETTRMLRTPSRTFTEHIVLARSDENIRVASARERESILKLKQMYFPETRKAPPVLFGAGVGAIVGGMIIASQMRKITGSSLGVIIGFVVGALSGGFLGVALGKVYQDYIEIKSYWRHLSIPLRIVFIVVVVVVIVSVWIIVARFR